MKAHIVGLAALLLTSSAPALPSWSCHPELRVEGLYLRPSTCELDFVIADERIFDAQPSGTSAYLPSGRAFSIRPDFDGGVRASIGYTLPPACWQARLIYTHICTTERRNFKPKNEGSLWPTIVHPRYTEDTPLFAPINNDELAGFALAKGSSEYEVVQLEVGKTLVPKCRLIWHPYAALQLAYLGNTLEAFYRGTENPGEASAMRYRSGAEWSKWCWGAGPLFGSDLRYCIAYGFGASLHLQIGVMAGQTHGNIRQHLFIEDTNSMALTDEDLDVRRRYRTFVFPFFEGKIGANYLWRCGKAFSLLIEFGYDFVSYINSVERFRFNDERGTHSSTCHNFNLDGVYLQFTLQL